MRLKSNNNSSVKNHASSLFCVFTLSYCVQEEEDLMVFSSISAVWHFLCLHMNVLTGMYVADKESGHYISPRLLYSAAEHTDLVKAIGCMDSRVYSGG